MKKAPTPVNELDRINALRKFEVLDTEPDETFDEITKLAARLCGTKIALVSLVDSQRQWFKSRFGLDAPETPRDISFCGHAIMDDDIFEIPDATEDLRFRDNPLTLNHPFVRFYAGVPLKTHSGHLIGTLCVIDSEKKKLSEEQKEILKTLAQHVVDLLEIRYRDIKLRESDRKYRLLFDQSVDPVMTLTPPRWSFTSANLATAKLFGVDTVEKFCQLAPWMVSPPTQPDGSLSEYKAKEMIELAMQKGSHFFEWLHCKVDGTLMICTVLLSRISQGGTDYLHATVRDVTEQKNAERAILESKKKLQLSNHYLDLALEGADLGVWDWNLLDNTVRYDRRWAMMLGLSLNQIEHNFTTWETRVHPDDIERGKNLIQAYLNGTIANYENVHRMRHADGSWVHILAKGKFSDWDASGRPIRFTGTHLNVTEQKMRELVSAEISMIRANYIENRNNKRSFLNYAVERLMNFSESSFGILGESRDTDGSPHFQSTIMCGDKYSDSEKQELISFFKLKDYSQGAFFVNHSDSLLCQNYIAFPICHDNKVRAVLCLVNRKQGYDQMQVNHINSIVIVVGEILNSIEISDELELQKNLTMHNAKLASLGQLAAGVGHEINNPLAIISGHLSITEQILRDSGVTNDMVFDRFKKIESAISRISNIVKGLRTFARSDGSQLNHFDVFEVVQETVDMLKDIYAKEEIALELIGDRLPANIFGNRGRIQQVLINLISNAKDATLGRAHRRIEIKILYGHKTISVAVKDNGVGISPEDREKVFEPFYTTKNVNDGTGIGLSLVSTIVKEHEGTVKLESQVSAWTCFTVTLPVEFIAPLKQVVVGVDEVRKKTDELFDLSVMIVDDEADLRDVLKYTLSKFCGQVHTFADALSALEFLKTNKIDLVISDMKMPKVDGVEFLQLIRKDGQLNQPKFVFISGGVDLPGPTLDMIQKEASGMLAKPFTREVVLQKLRDLFPEQASILKKAAGF